MSQEHAYDNSLNTTPATPVVSIPSFNGFEDAVKTVAVGSASVVQALRAARERAYQFRNKKVQEEMALLHEKEEEMVRRKQHIESHFPEDYRELAETQAVYDVYRKSLEALNAESERLDSELKTLEVSDTAGRLFDVKSRRLDITESIIALRQEILNANEIKCTFVEERIGQVYDHKFIVYCLYAGLADVQKNPELPNGDLNFTEYFDKLYIIENMLNHFNNAPRLTGTKEYLLNGDVTVGIDGRGNSALDVFEGACQYAVKLVEDRMSEERKEAIEKKYQAICLKIRGMGGISRQEIKQSAIIEEAARKAEQARQVVYTPPGSLAISAAEQAGFEDFDLNADACRAAVQARRLSKSGSGDGQFLPVSAVASQSDCGSPRTFAEAEKRRATVGDGRVIS